jgi:hypothetical protein
MIDQLKNSIGNPDLRFLLSLLLKLLINFILVGRLSILLAYLWSTPHSRFVFINFEYYPSNDQKLLHAGVSRCSSSTLKLIKFIPSPLLDQHCVQLHDCRHLYPHHLLQSIGLAGSEVDSHGLGRHNGYHHQELLEEDSNPPCLLECQHVFPT